MKQLISNFRNAPIEDADLEMLNYVAKLTQSPEAMIEQDVQALRMAGYSDAAILDINQVAGYYAYVNRLANGLGVELEHFWDEDHPLEQD